MSTFTCFRVSKFPTMSFDDFIKGSLFEKPFSTDSCLPGCNFRYTKPYCFERHIQTVHVVEFVSHVKSLLRRLGIDYRGLCSNDVPQPPPCDVSGHFHLNDVVQEFEQIQHERELPFDEDNDAKEDDISNVHSDSHIDSSSHSSKFFANLQNNFNHTNFDYVKRICDSMLLGLTETNITMEALTTVSQRILTEVFKHPDVNIDKDVIDSVQRIAFSKNLLESYVKEKETFVQPEPIIINGIEVGQYISIKKQAAIILKNKSIVQSIINEENQTDYCGEFAVYNSELTCCKERRVILLGNLRIELGADDFSVTTSDRQFFICYCSFTNIPVEERLKRKDTFLVVVAGRDEMQKANATVGDLLDKLVDDLKELEEIGIPVIIESRNGLRQTKMIKCIVSAVTGDNKGEVELLGLKKGFYKGFICRHCGTGLEEIQTKLDNFKLFDTDDMTEYNTDVAKAKEMLVAMKEAEQEKGGELSNYMKLKYKIVSKFGVDGDCVFNRLLFFCIFMNSPPDVLHDLAQGCIPRFLDLILRNITFRNSRKKLSFEEIKSILCSFPFINGQLQMSLKKNKAGIEQFHFHSKAVLKVEVLARLEEVLGPYMERDFTNIGYLLFRTLFDFCSAAFSFEVHDRDLKKMDFCAKKLITLTRTIRSEELLDDEELVGDEDEDAEDAEDENNNNNTNKILKKKKIHAVYSKLHTLLHYSELTKRYGPLVLFSTLKYERKHVFFKNLASIMRNYKNPCYTFAKRHQMFMVLTLEKTNFFERDLFEGLTGVGRLSNIKPKSFLTEDKHTKLKTYEYYIPSPAKNVLRKLLISRVEYWIHVKSIWSDKDQNIYAEGNVYKLSKGSKRDFTGNLNTVEGCKFEQLEPYSAVGELHVIDIRHLHYRKDFMSITQETSSNTKDSNDDTRYLFRGLM